MNKMGEMTVSPAIIANITCPVSVVFSQSDTTAPWQPEQLVRALGDRAFYHLFKADLGAGEHCAIGAGAQQTQITMDWLARILNNIIST
jgi:hypothetical protein